MNEAETRAELIDPQLKDAGWGVIEGSKVLREFHITAGKILLGGKKGKPLIADYVLVYKNRKLATIEAKSDELEVGEGVAQAKNYAHKLQLDFTYASNGKKIYQIGMKSGKEELIDAFPTPDELWHLISSDQNDWKDKFDAVPFESMGGTNGVRYYQVLAVTRTLNFIAEERKRILLTLATICLIVFLAVVVGYIVISIVLPILQIGQIGK